MNKLHNKSVFTDKELENLPLTYTKMESEKTLDVGELYVNTMYTSSKRHFSQKFIVYSSHKPISNFLINENSI